MNLERFWSKRVSDIVIILFHKLLFLSLSLLGIDPFSLFQLFSISLDNLLILLLNQIVSISLTMIDIQHKHTDIYNDTKND